MMKWILPIHCIINQCYMVDPAPNYQLAFQLVYSLNQDDVFLVIGASFYTAIAGQLREVAKSRGARIIEIQDDAAHNVRKVLESLLKK